MNSKRVVTLIVVFSMLLVGGCASPQSDYGLNNPELMNRMIARVKKKEREQVVAGKGDYMAPIYELIGAGERDAAIEKCEQYREFRPNDPVIYMLEGATYYNKGEFSTAVSRLSTAIAIDNALWPAYYYRGLGYRDLGEHRKALEDLDIVANSKSGPAQMVQYYDKFGEHNEAYTEDYMRGNILTHQAIVLSNLGDNARVIATLDRAISYAPSDGSSYLLRGTTYFSQQQYDLAYSDAVKAIELLPTEFNAWNLAGVINSRLGDYGMAVIQLEKANELKLNDGDLLTNLSLAYWLQGNQVKAFETIGKTLRGEPVYDTYYHAAYFYHINGRQDKALEYYRKSYELNRDILKVFTSGLNAIPVTSPTRKVFIDELAVAEKYLTTESTRAETVYENRPPTLKVAGVTLDPDPVSVNKPFDLHVSFKVDVANSSENTLPTVLKFTVLQGSKTLFSSEPYPIDVINGESEKFSLHMKPVPKKGTYTIAVVVKCQGLISKKSVELRIN